MTVTDGDALTALAADERLVLWQGDMSLLKTEAVVNSANAALTAGDSSNKSLNDALHTRAGEELRLACKKQMQAIRQKLGENYLQPVSIPMLTKGYNLPADYVIHVVGPAVAGALTDTHRAQLAACYKNTLMLCNMRGIRAVAFGCISAGAAGFPKEEAAKIATDTVRAHLASNTKIRRVIFNVFTEEDYQIYQSLLA